MAATLRMKYQSGRIYEVEMNLEEDTVLDVKQRFADLVGVPPAEQKWKHGVHELEDGRQIKSYHLYDGVTVEWSEFLHVNFSDWWWSVETDYRSDRSAVKFWRVPQQRGPVLLSTKRNERAKKENLCWNLSRFNCLSLQERCGVIIVKHRFLLKNRVLPPAVQERINRITFTPAYDILRSRGTSDFCARRVLKDWQQVNTNGCREIVGVQLLDNDPQHWILHVAAPSDSAYAGGVFEIGVRLPLDYPFAAPILYFRTTIYHPNVDPTEQTIQLFNPRDWDPRVSLHELLQFLPDFFNYPDWSYTLQPDMTPDDFMQKAYQMTQMHARKPPQSPQYQASVSK